VYFKWNTDENQSHSGNHLTQYKRNIELTSLNQKKTVTKPFISPFPLKASSTFSPQNIQIPQYLLRKSLPTSTIFPQSLQIQIPPNLCTKAFPLQ
jgi:hypothetical protein